LDSPPLETDNEYNPINGFYLLYNILNLLNKSIKILFKIKFFNNYIFAIEKSDSSLR